MKKRDYSILLYLLVIGIAILASSCSKTNDPKPVYKDISGNWTYSTLKTKADFTIEHIGSQYVVTKANVAVWKSVVGGWEEFSLGINYIMPADLSRITILANNYSSYEMNIGIFDISKDFTIITTSGISAVTPTNAQNETIVMIKRK